MQGLALMCPRCESMNTKFCYYNNYNLSQPRHFCKACRRYWTHGGTLRNVPVGGATRKRPNSTDAAASFSKRRHSLLTPPPPPTTKEPPEQPLNFVFPFFDFGSLISSNSQFGGSRGAYVDVFESSDSAPIPAELQNGGGQSTPVLENLLDSSFCAGGWTNLVVSRFQ